MTNRWVNTLFVGLCLGAVAQAETPLAQPAPTEGSSLPSWSAPERASWPTQEATAFPYLTWARGEYLLWWLKNGSKLPPLVTTGPETSANPGLVTAADTTVLFGNSAIDFGPFSGVRFAAGAWFDYNATVGLEVGGLASEQRSTTFQMRSDDSGRPVLGRPFIAADTQQQLVSYTAFPDRFAGSITISSLNRFWGLNANVIGHGFAWGLGNGELHVDFKAGFAFLSLEENLQIEERSTVLANGLTNFNGDFVGPGNFLAVRDSFATQDRFYGGKFGFRGEFASGRWIVGVMADTALGATHQSVQIDGSTTLLTPALAVSTLTGGLLATSTNIGAQDRNRFSVVPEIGLTLGYELIHGLRVYGGYSFLYWTHVLRPADQIDTTVNLTQVPTSPTFGPLTGPLRPALPFRDTDFWAQGLNFGIELRY